MSIETLVYPDKTIEQMHVGHASTRLREPQPLPKDFFVEPQYPDVNLEELRVVLPEYNEYYIDERNPFVVFMELWSEWFEGLNNQRHSMSEVGLVRMVQHRCGVNLNDADLANMRGLARDMITKPVVDTGVAARWHDPDFIERDPPPRVFTRSDGSPKTISTERRKEIAAIILRKRGEQR